jgi:hypothetical protein
MHTLIPELGPQDERAKKADRVPEEHGQRACAKVVRLWGMRHGMKVATCVKCIG